LDLDIRVQLQLHCSPLNLQTLASNAPRTDLIKLGLLGESGRTDSGETGDKSDGD
jgi:hypothetical protein